MSLRKLIIINSFLGTGCVKIEVGKHCAILGTNGIGKTSTLKLIPLFHGSEPTKYTSKDSAGSLSFNDYYLANSDSYIIFEYMTKNSPKMIVFSAANNGYDGRKITFINSGYSKDIFIDVDNSAFDSKHLITKLQSMNIDFYQAKSFLDYKDVLLTNSSFQSRTYSITKKNSLLQMPKLLESMFKRTVSFQHVGNMIAEYIDNNFEADGLTNVKKMNIGPDQFSSFYYDYRAHREIESRYSDFDEIERNLLNYYDALSVLQNILGAATKRLIDLESAKSLTESSFSDKISTLDQSIEDTKLSIKECEKRTNLFETKARELESKISLLISKKDEFEKVIHDHKYLSAYSAKTEIISEIANIESILIESGDLMNTISSKFSESRRAIESNRREKIQSIERNSLNKLSLINEEYLKNKSFTESNHHIEIHKIKSQIQAYQSSLNSTKIHIGQLEKDLITITATTQQAQRLRKAHDVKDEHNKKLSETKDLISEKREILSKLHTEVNGMLFDLEVKKKKLASLVDEQSKLLRILNANDGSFLSFIRNQLGNDKNNLNQHQSLFLNVFGEKALLNSDLNPKINPLFNAPYTTVFGVDLDTSKLLDTSDTYTLDSIEKRLLVVKSEISSISEGIDSIEKSCKKIKSKEKEITAEISLLDTKKISLIGLLENITVDIQSIQTEIDLHVENEKNRISEELDKSKQKLPEISVSLINQQSTLSTTEHQFESKISELESELNHKINEEKQLCTEVIQEHIIAFEEELLKNSQQMDAVIRENGLSDSISSELESKKRKLSCEYEKALTYEQTKYLYDLFIRSDYEEVAVLEKNLEDYKIMICNSRDHGLSLNDDLDNLGESLSSTDSDYKAAISEININYNLLKRVINRLQDINITPSDSNDFEHSSNNSLHEFSEKRIEAKRSAYSIISAKCNELMSVFSKHSNSSSYSYVNSFVISSSLDKELELSKIIINYRSDGHADKIYQNLINSLHFISQIDAFRKYIEQFSNAVRRFNKNLLEQINTNLVFPSISYIKPEISFSPKAVSSWEYVESISDEYTKWVSEPTTGSGKKEISEPLFNAIENFMKNGDSSISASNLSSKINFSCDIVENGKSKYLVSEKDINSLSSNGLNYIILLVIFLGFSRLINNNNDVRIVWALDELANLSMDNVDAMLKLLDDNNISLVSACPSLSPENYDYFHSIYLIESKEKKITFTERLKNDDLLELYS